jgi:hypothetical protein
MQTQISNPSGRRPKSRGRLAIDVVLFLAVGAVVGWSGLHRIGEGVVTLRRGPEVFLASQPGLFWTLTGLHVAVVLICLALSGLAAWTLLRSLSDGARR